MDSDDDFMSEASSHEETFEDSPESEIGSLGDGPFTFYPNCHPRTNIY